MIQDKCNSQITYYQRPSRLTCQQADYYASMIALNVTEQTDLMDIRDRFKELKQSVDMSTIDGLSEEINSQ